MNFPLYSLPRVLRESKFGSVLCRPEYKAQLYLTPIVLLLKIFLWCLFKRLFMPAAVFTLFPVRIKKKKKVT